MNQVSQEIDTSDAITYPVLNDVKVEKRSFQVKKEITTDRLYGDRCDENALVANAEKITSAFSDTDI